MSTGKVDPRVRCKFCQSRVFPKNLARHEDSESCRWKGRNIKLQSQGLIGYSQDSVIGKMVGMDEIPEAKMLSYQYTAYVPKWVHDAYEIWSKNKGFAELPFREFLSKMRSEVK